MAAGYVQDPLRHIVNVNWGGAIFIYGTLNDHALYYVAVSGADKPPDQQTIVPPGSGNPAFGLSCYGSSYHPIVKNLGQPDEKKIPTFLICGNKAGREDPTDPFSLLIFYTIIYYSNDGLKWIVAREQAGTPTLEKPNPGANPVALVWDEDNNEFFYDQNFESKDQIFLSSDGTDWSMVSSTSTDGNPDYRSAFTAHCANNDCVDERGQHVPDGVMANQTSEITAKPVKPPIIDYAQGTSSISFSSDGETWGSDMVEITVTELVEGVPTVSNTTVAVPGLKKVFCVAAAGGILMAGGSPDPAGDTGAVVMSGDRGVTWKLLVTRASSVTTMVAAPGI